MTELNLTPMGDNGSYYYSTVTISGSSYTDASIYGEFYDSGKIWVEISYDNNQWFLLPGSTSDVFIKNLIPLNSFNRSLLYRVCVSQKIKTLKLIY